ncbi:hypothetical protein CcCBS67573_g08596 [Chytriomyces confervae]|uniref:Uncharacterized protein n=1 Tax=Chytriomyces confervae TaxID=246404 RepID=A0A507EKN6_9FUNG|nr:hypothetical protein CcCBS67573_g08596 [Chytriomyces confervae]
MREEYSGYSADSLRIRAPVYGDRAPARQGAAGELVALTATDDCVSSVYLPLAALLKLVMRFAVFEDNTESRNSSAWDVAEPCFQQLNLKQITAVLVDTGASSDQIMSHTTHGKTDTIKAGSHAHSDLGSWKIGTRLRNPTMLQQPCGIMIDGLAERSLQGMPRADGLRDSSMVDTQSAMTSVTTHSPKGGSLKGTGESSLVEWQELASRSQQIEEIVRFSGATTSNTARTEHDGSGMSSSKNCSEAHNQTEDSAGIARAIQIEVNGEQDLSKDDGRTEISRRVAKGGQEFVVQRTQSLGETLAKSPASEPAGMNFGGQLHSSSASAESMIALNLRQAHVHSTAACNVHSAVGLLVDNDGDAPDVVQSADTTNSSLGARTHRSNRLEKDITAISDSAIFSPAHPDILADTASDMVLNAGASHGSGRAGGWSLTIVSQHLSNLNKFLVQQETLKSLSSAETFEAPENTTNGTECDDVKFEGRVTRLSRKHQLEASSQPSTKKHRTSSATYVGRIEDTLDAGILIEACIKGILRAVGGAMEVSSIEIRPGTVLVIHERDGNIQRWRDGYHWSPSRISGGFLIYRQVERKGSVPTTETEETQTIPSASDGSKLTKAKSFTVLPDGLTKKTIGMIGSDRQSYRVISYYETDDARVRTSLINIRELDSPRISAYKALPRPSKDETFSSLGLYPKDADPSISNGWKSKRKRRAVVIPQIDRRYPEYEPQMSDYPIMFPYRNDPAATDESQETASTTEKLVHRKGVSNGQPSSSHQKRAITAPVPQYSREFAVGHYLNAPAPPPLVAFTSSSSSYMYHPLGNTLHYSLFAQYDAYQGMTGGSMSQQQQYQQQYTLGPGYFQPPSGYGPRPSPSNGHHPL